MDFISQEVRDKVYLALLGSGSSFLAWLVSNIAAIKEILQVAALIAGGIVVPSITVWAIVYQTKRNRAESRRATMEEAAAEASLCAKCRMGERPPFCPISPKPKKCMYPDTPTVAERRRP